MKSVILVALTVAVALATFCRSEHAIAQAEPEETPAGEEQSATARALEELAAAYEGLSGFLDQGSDEAVDRVQEDIENLGDWEYRIVVLRNSSPEAVEAELNLLGDERWEVYWIHPLASELRVYLKRPSISYLSRLPLSALVRILATGGP